MHPRQIGETSNPVEPSFTQRMAHLLHVVTSRTVPGTSADWQAGRHERASLRASESATRSLRSLVPRGHERREHDARVDGAPVSDTYALSGTGIWSAMLRFGDPSEVAELAAEMEGLGYSALWIPDTG